MHLPLLMAADTTNVLVLEHEILPVLTQRRSPRAYANQLVPVDVLHQVFAAASSASSCFGEQPWHFLVGTRAGSVEAYDKVLASLAEFNQPWAKAALVLVMSLARTTFSHDSNPNAWDTHDVGQAVATPAIQGTELGVQIHQMTGFSADKVRAAFGVPAGYEPVAIFTLGYPGALALVKSLVQRLN
ncbi:nitroreductase family protein [Hymenobacter sp. H14-R3]|uniref:nitroreductase family protein n=1 Tax=Hymenobacter sp. H14-R3 TaxID=3046308 RepID=UPI0024BACAAC|nr:nitroreductase family protein [Hymenobacter sp. H14-R3]MDJ0368038.1 nitroreductase family protein [Hymenobacter sp. H14-R3]